MPPARPLPSISPTQAISFEGELMPKKLQIPSQMPEIQPDTLSQIHPARLWIPCHSPCTMFLPILTICPIDEVKAFTIPAMICGTAFTISTIMVGRFWISETNSCTPAWMIWGMLFKMAFTSEEIICGIAATMVVMTVGRF